MMKIFISYKQTGVEDRELVDKLSKIREILNDLGHDTFIFYFDNDLIEKTPQDIINVAKTQISSSDIVLAFVNYDGKSEGMMLELGLASGMNKKIMLLMNTDNESEYYLSYGISDNTVLFSDFGEIKNILHDNFPHA